MNKDILYEIIIDIPKEVDIILYLFNGQKITLRNSTNITMTKKKYKLFDEYVMVSSSADKRQSTSFLYIPYHQIAYVEGTGIIKSTN